ncbi:RsmE family RNA methyltransferase [Candidatus Omnitrophota bacterium]
MHRLFTVTENISKEKVVVTDKNQIHHFRDVLRVKQGQELVVFDDRGNEYKAKVQSISLKSLVLKINKMDRFVREDKQNLTIACAIPKKSKMDDIIDKLTQLGVDRVIPLLTRRVIVKLDARGKKTKLERWRKVALSASQQSQRKLLPVIEPIKSLQEVLSQSSGFGLKLIPALLGERKAIKDIIKNSQAKNILVLIGPEGDFTPEEVQAAVTAGCVPVTLGETVLRVETAALAVASYIRLHHP